MPNTLVWMVDCMSCWSMVVFLSEQIMESKTELLLMFVMIFLGIWKILDIMIYLYQHIAWV